VERLYPPREGALRWRGGRRQNVAREAHGGFKSLLASRLRPLSSKATHPPNYRSLHKEDNEESESTGRLKDDLTPTFGRSVADAPHADTHHGLLQPVSKELQCPAQVRDCTHLRWHVQDRASDVSRCSLPTLVPRTTEQVASDSGALATRLGYVALPAALGVPLEDHKAVRFYPNAFYVWDI